MKKYLNLILLVIVGITISACSNSNEPELTFDNLLELVNSVDVFPTPSSYSKVGDGENPNKIRVDVDTLYGEWLLQTTMPYKLTQRFEATANLNANQSDIYPGSIVQGKYLIEGRAVSIGDNFARKPITITMANGGGSIEIEKPSYSAISTAMNSLVAQKNPIPAVIDYQMIEMYSVEQALMEFGFDIGWGFLSAGAMYQTNILDKRNSVFLCFKQIYYTMSIGNNRSATDLFEADVNVNQLATKTGAGNPLCVINEVDYGRIIMVRVTSTENHESITKSIKAGIKFINSGGGSFTTSASAFNSTYEFKAQVIGGKASDGAKIVDGMDAVFDIIKKGADYADGNPGFPITYRATYLKNNEPVLTGKTTSYDEVVSTEKEGEFGINTYIVLNKFPNNVTTITNPTLEINIWGTESGYSYVNGKYNGTFKAGDTLDNIVGTYRTGFKTHKLVSADKETEVRFSIYLKDENEVYIISHSVTFKIGEIINMCSFGSGVNGALGGIKVLDPYYYNRYANINNDAWQSTFYIGMYLNK